MITCKVETIDRDAAERYLNIDRGNNRPFSKNHLADLVGRQMRGEWVTNGDTIRFDTENQLRDGQHRLRMVKQTGVPIEVVVIHDIDTAAFSTMDIGKRRSLGDVLYIEHEKNHTQLAGTLAWVWRYLSRKVKMPKAGSYEEMHKILDQHSGLRDSVTFYLNLERPLSTPGWTAVNMAVHYLFSQVESTAANDFIEKYVTGLGLVEPTDPIKVLRDQIIKYASDPRKPSTWQIFMLLCRAWNDHQRGQSVKKKYTLPKVATASPKIAGFPKELFLESQLSFEENEDEEEE